MTLHAIQPEKPPAELAELAEMLKQGIDTGKIRGVLVLIAAPGHKFVTAEAGEYDVGTMLLAFEDWKHAEMKRLAHE
jgi:hypothetical protein